MNIVNTQFCHLLFHIFLIHVVVDGTFSKKPSVYELNVMLVTLWWWVTIGDSLAMLMIE